MYVCIAYAHFIRGCMQCLATLAYCFASSMDSSPVVCTACKGLLASSMEETQQIFTFVFILS